MPSLSLPYVFPEGVPVWLAPLFSVKDGDRFAPSDSQATPADRTCSPVTAFVLASEFWEVLETSVPEVWEACRNACGRP